MTPTPRPWRITGKFPVTVVDADNKPIGFLTDLELGWTDTETGNYVDPKAEYDLLVEIVRAVNTLDEVKAALADATAVLDGLFDDNDAVTKVQQRLKAVLAKLEGD